MGKSVRWSRLFFVLGFFLAPTPTPAAGTCTESEAETTGMEARLMCTEDGETLGLFVTPALPPPEEGTESENRSPFPPRTYVFLPDGTFQVINNYPQGGSHGSSDFHSTGTRTFLLFPRNQQLSIAFVNGAVRVQSGSGLAVDFSPQSGRIVGARGGTVEEDPEVNPDNRAGVEIPAYEGILLDTGFKIGKAGYEDPDGRSTFRDASGRTCRVRNRDLFDYEYVEYERNGATRTSLVSADFKFTTDADLAAFLARRSGCEDLDLSPLLGTGSQGAALPQGRERSDADHVERLLPAPPPSTLGAPLPSPGGERAS